MGTEKGEAIEITGPEPLSAEHHLASFDSGEPALDDWLRRRARQNETSGASRTYVVCTGGHVVGYYTLAVGAVAHDGAPSKLKRNLPEHVRVMLLGRLAVDETLQGRGIGTGLLQDAVLRTMRVAEMAGIRGILIHAMSGDATRFYEKYGFVSSPIDPLTVMITIAEAVKILGRPRAV